MEIKIIFNVNECPMTLAETIKQISKLGLPFTVEQKRNVITTERERGPIEREYVEKTGRRMRLTDAEMASGKTREEIAADRLGK